MESLKIPGSLPSRPGNLLRPSYLIAYNRNYIFYYGIVQKLQSLAYAYIGTYTYIGMFVPKNYLFFGPPCSSSNNYNCRYNYIINNLYIRIEYYLLCM
jgi:hypothetical protein